MPSSSGVTATRASFADLVRYFLYLGAFGFGGPVALAGFMHRDLVETRRWIDEEEYRLALALAQIMPGPLAAQLAIALGYFQRGIVGATAVGVAFVIPSFLMVVAISIAYRRYGGLWWMQALFYGIGTSVPAPWFRRNRDNARLKAFVQGATAAATGALAGAVIVLASRAIYDVPTAAIALASLAVLWRFKIPEPVLVAAAGAIGLVVWPLMRGGS